jgi:hypothetical protein
MAGSHPGRQVGGERVSARKKIRKTKHEIRNKSQILKFKRPKQDEPDESSL